MKKLLPLLVFFTFNLTALVTAQDDANFQAGERAYATGNYPQAEDYYSRYIKTFEDKLPAYLKSIHSYDTSSSYEKAALFPDFSPNHEWAVGYYKRGLANMSTNSFVQAGKDLDMAIQIDPKYAAPYLQKGFLVRVKDKKEACKYFSKAKWLDDTVKAARNAYRDNFCWMCGIEYFVKGKTEVELKQYAEAMQNLNTAIMYCHDSGNYYTYRGIAYEGLEKFDSAIADYSYSIKLDSTNYTAYYRRALTYEKAQKYKEAFADLAKALSINPTFANAYLHQAADCESLDMGAASIYDYQQVIRLNPTEGIAWYKIGLHKKQNGEEACDYFQKAADLGYDDAQAYVDDCKKEEAKRSLK